MLAIPHAALKSRDQSGFWHAAMVGFAILLTWGLLIGDLHQEYHDAIDAAQRETVALSRGLGETTVTAFDTIDQTLKDLREAFGRDPEHFDLPSWFDAHRFGTGLIIQTTIIDKDGIVLKSNLPLAGRIDLSDREHVRFQKVSLSDQMFISRPVLGRVSKKPSLNVTRKIISSDGSYNGTVVVSAGLDYLERFLAALSSRGVIEIVGTKDQIIRSRAPADMTIIGGVKAEARHMIEQGSGIVRTEMLHGDAALITSFDGFHIYPFLVSVCVEAVRVFDD